MFCHKWCPRSDSNRHTSRYRILNPARLPIPPQGHEGILAYKRLFLQDSLSPSFGRFFCFGLGLSDIEPVGVDHVLDVVGVEFLDHFHAGAAVLGDRIDARVLLAA